MGDAFESIVGAAHVRAPQSETLDGIPIAKTVCPGDVEEVCECLRLAHRDRIAVVPRGGGSKLAWGNVPEAASVVVLELGRLRTGVVIDAEEGIARIPAGLPLVELQAALRSAGRRAAFAPAPGAATVGGCVAADPPTPGPALDGGLRQDLLGLEVVGADGTRTRCGGSVVKNVTGFDLVRLYCGSLGTLGVLTEVILRLRPLPPRQIYLGRPLRSIHDVLAVLASLSAQRVEPDAAVVAAGGSGLRLLWSLAGTEHDVADRAERLAGDPVDPADWDAAIQASFGAPSRESGVRVRLGARATDLADIWLALEDLAGTEHVGPAFPLSGMAWAELPQEQLAELCTRVRALDGTWTLERAPAETKRRYGAFGPLPTAIALLREIKRRFDPDRVLGPGRFWGGI